jgi:hypothetical protein
MRRLLANGDAWGRVAQLGRLDVASISNPQRCAHLRLGLRGIAGGDVVVDLRDVVEQISEERRGAFRQMPSFSQRAPRGGDHSHARQQDAGVAASKVVRFACEGFIGS